MLVYSLNYLGFTDGTSRSTQNLASADWEIYAPTDELISLHGVFLGRATNNIVKYSAFIQLLFDDVSHGIRHLLVRMDSQLVVLQLSNVYFIRRPMLLRAYL
jgi:ribonuclease HI